MQTKHNLTRAQHTHMLALMRIRYRTGGWMHAMQLGRELYAGYNKENK